MQKKIRLFLTSTVLMFILGCFQLPIFAAAPLPIENNQVYYLKNVYSQRYMDCAGSSASSRIIQNTFNGSDYQKFKLSFVDYIGSTPYYNIIPMINQNLRVDIDNARDANATIVKAFTSNGSVAQKFAFGGNGDNTYRIQLSYTGSNQIIEIAGSSIADSAIAQTWGYVGAKNQQWILELVNAKETSTDNIKASLNQDIYDMDVSALLLSIKNNNNQTINTGKDFQLEKFVNGSWQKYYLKQTFWDLIGFGLNPGISQNFSLVLSDVTSEKLSVGTYRIVKNFNADNSKIKIPVYAEFQIADKNEVSSYSNINLSLPQSSYPSDTSAFLLTIQNNSDKTISTGEDFQLEKLVNGSWQKYYPKQTIWDLIGFQLKPAESMNLSLTFSDVTSQKLEVGYYRIVKTFNVENVKNGVNVYTEFDIK